MVFIRREVLLALSRDKGKDAKLATAIRQEKEIKGNQIRKK